MKKLWRRMWDYLSKTAIGRTDQAALDDDYRLVLWARDIRQSSDNEATIDHDKHAVSALDSAAMIKKANDFVAQTGIDKSLCAVAREALNWPSSVKTAYWDGYNYLGVEDVSGSEGRNPSSKDYASTNFRFSGQRYIVAFVGEKFHHGSLYLTVEDKIVFGIGVKAATDGLGYEPTNIWKNRPDQTNIEMLKVGEWVKTLIQWQVDIESHKRRFAVEFEARRLSGLASNIKL